MMKDEMHIFILLDRSGSMSNIKSDVIGGINSLIEEQQKDGRPTKVSLAQFDHFYNPNGCLNYFDVDIKNVTKLDSDNYRPTGSTALYDSFGESIDKLGTHFAKLPESERPNKVLVVCYTDGYENASTKFSLKDIQDKVKHQSSQYAWEFVFLGADIDGYGIGTSLGVAARNSVPVNKSDAQNTFKDLSASVTRYRSSNAFTYNSAE